MVLGSSPVAVNWMLRRTLVNYKLLWLISDVSQISQELQTSNRRSHRRCSVKKVLFLKFCKIHRKTPVSESFFNKVAVWVLKRYQKMRIWHRYFPMNFVKFLTKLFCRTTPMAGDNQISDKWLLLSKWCYRYLFMCHDNQAYYNITTIIKCSEKYRVSSYFRYAKLLQDNYRGLFKTLLKTMTRFCKNC